ncbi:MAG: NfeD family protein [Hydrogenophaga sp.]|uniref:NfeD family protein n=1 Tax=Hydrogenophaga sp. TaxID=1904254 RepID=UPI002779A403|nr:NfeD family protein [Hydrogenophaga sp.]MDP2416817.1 NfeD family protein [Hydrogenophaga sp.]MDZ4188751.1 NfeD family protein [Hydrogenophaga sp.]
MSDSTIWWLLVGSAVALELFTGTFYLLMLALGMAAAAVAAHAGAGTALQLICAAGVGTAAVVGCYAIKKRNPADPSVRSLRSVNLDVGEIVQVEEWRSDGTASVKYRGAQWSVVQRPGNAPAPGAYRVTELVGNRLLVEKV